MSISAHQYPKFSCPAGFDLLVLEIINPWCSQQLAWSASVQLGSARDNNNACQTSSTLISVYLLTLTGLSLPCTPIIFCLSYPLERFFQACSVLYKTSVPIILFIPCRWPRLNKKKPKLSYLEKFPVWYGRRRSTQLQEAIWEQLSQSLTVIAHLHLHHLVLIPACY